MLKLQNMLELPPVKTDFTNHFSSPPRIIYLTLTYINLHTFFCILQQNLQSPHSSRPSADNKPGNLHSLSSENPTHILTTFITACIYTIKHQRDTTPSSYTIQIPNDLPSSPFTLKPLTILLILFNSLPPNHPHQTQSVNATAFPCYLIIHLFISSSCFFHPNV